MTVRVPGWRGSGKTPQWKVTARRVKSNQSNSSRRPGGGKHLAAKVSLPAINLKEDAS